MKVTLTFNGQRRAAYRQQGLWGDASLADYWQQTARAMPDKIAVVDNHGASCTPIARSITPRAVWQTGC
ncbi:hypothetical protein O5340_16460 [Escherichia coli]|nr:hypothetical protein [Escherichia coli]